METAGMSPFFRIKKDPEKTESFWCGRRDSNPHEDKPQQILSLLCLPFHHIRAGTILVYHKEC